MNKNFEIFLYFVAFLIAVILRTYDIDYRPFHHDEGVNFHFIKRMKDLGYYPYSHQNYHGPLYFYLLYFITKIFGYSEIVMRSIAILSGLAVIPLVYYFKNILGITTSLIFVYLFAVSPNQIFMNRYNIHESTLIFAELLLCLGVYSWIKTFKSVYIYLSFIGLALMISTKETFVIYLASIFFAIFTQISITKFFNKYKENNIHFSIGFLISVILLIFIFSGGFTWLNGLKEMFLAVPQWVGRGTSDTGHFKSWSYYICILFGESVFRFPFQKVCNGSLNYTPSIGSDLYYLFIPILIGIYIFLKSNVLGFLFIILELFAIGLIAITGLDTIPVYLNFLANPKIGLNLFMLIPIVFGCLIYFKERRGERTFLSYISLSSVFVFYLYSFVNYKTPWLIINLTIGVILLFSHLSDYLIKNFRYRNIIYLIVLFSFITSAMLSYRFNFDVEDGKNNPYYYVHTRKGMIVFIEDLKKYSNDNTYNLYLGVNGYWPLPYYFESIKNIKVSYPGKTLPSDLKTKYHIVIVNPGEKVELSGFIKKYYRFSDHQEADVYFKVKN